MTEHPAPESEPRWPAAAAVVAAALLPVALPRSLSIAPAWTLASAVVVLSAAALLARRAGRHRLNAWLGYAVLLVLTMTMLFSLVRLVTTLPQHAETAGALLQSAVVLWTTNVVVFASWYWRVDAGGPHERDRRSAHVRGAFLFPQMMVPAPGDSTRTLAEAEHWRPGFFDYLALAVFTSTAFSPTDVPPISRWAKVAMMIQALISFGTVALLASRAVNIF